MALHNLDITTFLADDWQRQPRLIRQALPNFRCPVEGDDLAGLACEDGVESRLIFEKGQHWTLRDGPFSPGDFAALPASNWTLLVQAVDQWVPEVAALLEHFSFIPRWRIDDVMVSYASDGGGVGPHFDHYDVFLVQGQGRRRWRIGQYCDDSSPLKADIPLHQLQDFQAEQEWVLEPGDILYLPPKLAHWGTAVGDDCITLSVGFRAPSHAELLGHWCDEIAQELPDSLRYRDPPGSLQAAGEISGTTLDAVRHILLDHLCNTDQLADWFGRLMTTPKYEAESPEQTWTLTELRQLLNEGAILQVSLSARLAMTGESDGALLFADGESYPLCEDSLGLAKKLSSSLPGATLAVIVEGLNTAELGLLLELLNNGSLHFCDESD